MEISYTNDTLQTEERIKKVKKLIEDGASPVEHTLEGKPIYKLGNCHGFLIGFWTSYATECGIEISAHHSGTWIGHPGHLKLKELDNNVLTLDNEYNEECERLRLERIEHEKNNPIDWSTLEFPVIKNISVKTIADTILPVKPMSKKKRYVR